MATRDSLQMKVGEEHSIALEGLMTSGYVWEPEVAGDESVAEVTKEQADDRDPGVAFGGSSREAFKIKAVRPGTVTVRFAQRRPWDPDNAADERVVDLRVIE